MVCDLSENISDATLASWTWKIRPDKEDEDWWPVSPIPAGVPPCPEMHPKYGRWSKRWGLRDGDGLEGELYGYACCFDRPNGGTAWRPLSWCVPIAGGPGQWRWRTHEITEHIH